MTFCGLIRDKERDISVLQNKNPVFSEWCLLTQNIRIMLVHLGDQEYSFPSQALGQLADHTDLHHQGDWQTLRSELERLGYLRIKQLHDRDQVLTARTGQFQLSYRIRI